MKYCRKCGAPLLDDALFCGECGAKVETTDRNVINEEMPKDDLGFEETLPTNPNVILNTPKAERTGILPGTIVGFVFAVIASLIFEVLK